MVAYSFQPCFVVPIRRLVSPKRQTIRAERKRHAIAGEKLQLYCRQRCKDGYLIGTALCDEVLPIRIEFAKHSRVTIGNLAPIAGRHALNQFAYADGFGSWEELQWFWEHHHRKIVNFSGQIIFWGPLIYNPVSEEHDNADNAQAAPGI